MARNRTIGRSALTEREEQRASTAVEQADYRAMLDEDFGRPDFSPHFVADDGRPVGLLRLLIRPFGLFMFAVMMFFAVLMVRFWHDGMFDGLWAPQGAAVGKGSTRWTLGDRLRPPKEEVVPEPAILNATDAKHPDPAVPADEVGDGESETAAEE